MQHSCLLGQAGADVPPDEGRGATGEVAGGWRTDGWGSGVRFEGSGRGSQGTQGGMGVSKVAERRRERAGKLRPTGLTAAYRPAHCPSSRTRDFIREGGMERRSPDRHRSPQGSETPIAIPRMALRPGSAGLQAGIVPRRFAGGRDEPQTAAWLPSRRIPKRHGDAQARERRPPVGTAARSATGETNLKQRHGSRLGVSPGGTATRRQGNADLRSAQPRAARRARRTSNSGMAPVPAYPQGNADLWSAGTSNGGRHGDAQARERRPLASSPGGGRHSRAQRGGRDEPQTAAWLPSRRIPRRHGDAQARERRPRSVGGGTAARSAAGETNLKQRDGPVSAYPATA